MFNPIDAPATFPVPPAPTLPRYSSDDILAMDIEAVAELCEPWPAQWLYTLTEGEAGWLRWAADRYAVATAILDASEEDDNGEITLTIDDDLIAEIGEALVDDGTDRASCLSDDTALQRIVWCIGPIEAD